MFVCMYAWQLQPGELARVCTDTETLAQTQTDTQTHAHASKHACMHACMHARTHTYTHTNRVNSKGDGPPLAPELTQAHLNLSIAPLPQTHVGDKSVSALAPALGALGAGVERCSWAQSINALARHLGTCGAGVLRACADHTRYRLLRTD